MTVHDHCGEAVNDRPSDVLINRVGSVSAAQRTRPNQKPSLISLIRFHYLSYFSAPLSPDCSGSHLEEERDAARQDALVENDV